MCRFVFLCLFELLFFSSRCLSAHLETLMENVVVLRVQDIDGSKVTVPISCGDSSQGRPVIWKKNGFPEPELQGNHIEVMVKEWDGGNYTCHLGLEEEPLNYTVIMVQLEPDNQTVILEKNHDRGYIHCSTPNYRGLFYCSWNRTEIRSDAAVLLVKGHRNQETVLCEVEPSGSGMWCKDNSCPYKEEQHRISLTVYVYSESRLEAYTKAFYLWEIVTPGRLPNLHLYDNKVFRWDYPQSWEKPCSYFSLLFQVKLMPRGGSCDSDTEILTNTTSETEYQVHILAKRYVFCVRAQDRHTEGPWSHWSKCTVNQDKAICTP